MRTYCFTIFFWVRIVLACVRFGRRVSIVFYETNDASFRIKVYFEICCLDDIAARPFLSLLVGYFAKIFAISSVNVSLSGSK